jgi:hypothetical protein
MRKAKIYVYTKQSVEIFDVAYHCFQLKLPLFSHSFRPMPSFQCIIVLPLCLSIWLQITDLVHHELLLVVWTHVHHIFRIWWILVLRLLQPVIIPPDYRWLMLLLIPMKFCYLIILYRSPRYVYLFSDPSIFTTIEHPSRLLPQPIFISIIDLKVMFEVSQSVHFNSR